jgi:hypothetical protein
MRITVACDELRAGWTEHTRDRQVVDVPADAAFDAVSIDVLFGVARAAALQVDHAFLVGEMACGDGGPAVTVARARDLDVPVRLVLAPQIAEALEGIRTHGWDGSTASRLVIFGGDGDSYLRQVEIAADPD